MSEFSGKIRFIYHFSIISLICICPLFRTTNTYHTR